METARASYRIGVDIGYPFYDRCPLAVEGTCDRETPPIRRLADGHAIECHRSEEEFMH